MVTDRKKSDLETQKVKEKDTKNREKWNKKWEFGQSYKRDMCSIHIGYLTVKTLFSLHPSLFLSPFSSSIHLSEEFPRLVLNVLPLTPLQLDSIWMSSPSLLSGAGRGGVLLHNEVMRLNLEHSASLTMCTSVFVHVHVRMYVCVRRWVWIDDQSISGALCCMCVMVNEWVRMRFPPLPSPLSVCNAPALFLLFLSSALSASLLCHWLFFSLLLFVLPLHFSGV